MTGLMTGQQPGAVIAPNQSSLWLTISGSIDGSDGTDGNGDAIIDVTRIINRFRSTMQSLSKAYAKPMLSLSKNNLIDARFVSSLERRSATDRQTRLTAMLLKAFNYGFLCGANTDTDTDRHTNAQYICRTIHRFL